MVKIERSFPAPESLQKKQKRLTEAIISPMWWNVYTKISIINAISVKSKICRTRMWNIYFPIKMENTQKENLIGKIFSGPAATAMELKITATMIREF